MMTRFNKCSYLFIIMLFIFLLTSCSKQKSPTLAEGEVKATREIQRLEACTKVNFNKGVLLYQNMMQLFVCTKWDEQFPSMFQSMNKITASSWDHLMAPIDQSFVENQQRRDRVFKNINELDAKGGLNDLSSVIVALNETNFFDSTNALFKCIENPINPVCLSRLGRVPEKKSIKNIINLIDTSPENIDNLSQIMRFLINALDGHKEELRTEVNKFRESPLFMPSRLAIVDALAEKAQAGFSNDDLQLFSKILLSEDESTHAPWIYSWIQNKKMNRDKFRDLIEYPVLVDPNFTTEVRGIKNAYNDKFVCTFKNSPNPNDLIDFDLKSSLFEFSNIIKTRKQAQFFEDVSSKLVGIKLSSEICGELSKNKYNFDFSQVLIKFAQFMSEKNNYELGKFLLNQTIVKADSDKTLRENIYLVDMVAGNFFSAANALNADIFTKTRTFYPLMFDILKSLPVESYNSFGEMAVALGQPENNPQFKSIADLWNFFSSEEKNFLFKFIDRHFDKETDYILLFDFYTKFLDELKEVQPVLKEKWNGTPEKSEASYLALQEIFTQFSGKDTLVDFKNFFSRTQILKVLEVISKGQVINREANAKLEYMNSDNYIIRSRSERYKFIISYAGGLDSDPGYDSKAVMDCMQKFTDIQNGLYFMIRNLPSACSKVTGANIAFKIYGWLNSVEDNYLQFKNAPDNTESLLDKNGLLSPNMINTSAGLAKIIDDLVGPSDSIIPTKNGIKYLITSAGYHLNQKKAVDLIDKDLRWIQSLQEIMPEKNSDYRNALIKSFTINENFDYSKTFFNNLGWLLKDYGNWVKNGEFNKAQTRVIGEENKQFDCDHLINKIIAPNPCPSKEQVKTTGNTILATLQRDFGNGTPVKWIMEASKFDGGLLIPLGSSRAKKFRISLRDIFRSFYDTSDKSMEVNRLKVNYKDENENSSLQTVTTLERLEAVVREVSFDNNYLGVSFFNSVVFGSDYDSDVSAKKKLFKTCLKIPGIRCTRKMSKDNLRKAHNSLEFFDSLLDLNNGRGLEPKLNFGNFFKTMESFMVGSSDSDAQKVQVLPLKDDALIRHNGKIAVELSNITALSNAARVIRDRIGRKREDFDNFINSKEFKRVDQALLYGFDIPTAALSAKNIINKLRTIPENEKNNLFEYSVDWVAQLNYNDTRLLEDTLARLIMVGSFLGPPEVVFNETNEIDKIISDRYSKNNLFQMFLAIEKVIDYWPTLKKYFPDANLIDVVKPINTALYYLTNKLNSGPESQKNTAYLVLNDLFLVLQKSLFENMDDADIKKYPAKTVQGLDLALEMFKDPKLVTETYSVIRNNYFYLDILHADSGEWFSSVGRNISKMALAPRADLSSLKDYLSFTTKKDVCLSGSGICKPNYHYDEPASLVKYLTIISDSKISNFKLLNQKIFIENVDQINQMIGDLLPCIKIKEIKSPLLN